ncbi:MAG TPA: hypothetical protein VH142_12305 [Polyangiaceae bacterium]|nr:hypothetical protein [Polyangiaceae bacterium]
MELQAQLPDELSALIDGDSVPKQGVRISLRFLLSLPKDPDFGTSPRILSALGVEVDGHAAHG